MRLVPKFVGPMLEIFRYNLKVTFSTRYWFLLVGGLVYFVIVWLIHFFAEPDERLVADDILNGLLSPAAVFLAILLGMQLVLSERDRRSIEVIFAISRSRYQSWVIKALTVYLAIFLLVLLLAGLAYIFITDFPFFSSSFNAMVPALIFGNLTVLFSILTRSTNAAAMLSCLVLFLVFFSQAGWDESFLYPFLNPLVLERSVEPEDYYRILVQNRVMTLALAFVLLAVALQRMNRRERLL